MKLDKKAEAAMLDRRDWLKRWISLRNYDIGIRADNFLYCYHCTNLALYSHELSLKLLHSMNDMLITPLPADTIEKIAAQKLQRLSNEKIILWLGITTEEIDLLRIGHNKAEMEARKARQMDAAITCCKIMDMYTNGKSTSEIAAAFPQLSKRTIQRYIAKHREQMQTAAELRLLEKEVVCLSLETSDLNSIARRAKCSVDTVRQILNLQGMTKITKQETQKEITELSAFTTEEGEQLFYLSSYKTERTNLDDYDIALAALKTYKHNIMLFGGAGTGKSYLIRAFLASLPPSERAATLVVAPTGRAADHLDAQTIHKAFQFPNEVQPNEEITTAPKHLFSISRIIIDEINMVRIDVFSKLIKTLRFVEQQTQKKIQVIVLGDFGQIQPVATAADLALLKEFYPSAKGVYAFHSEQWEQMNFRKIVLKHVYRQSDPVFIEKLNEIKYGNVAAIQWFNDNSMPLPNPKGITICPTRKLVDYYNSQEYCLYEPDDIVEFHATLNDKTNEEPPCPESLSLAVGMRVMTVCNAEKYKNGSIGSVKQINKSSVQILFDNGELVTVGKRRFILPDGVIYEQIPVVLAYAITANKSEGMTFEEINVVPGYFAPGQLYTALSRCKSISGICIEGELTAKDLIVDVEALRMTIE